MKTSGIEKTVRKVLRQPELLDIFSLRWGLDRRAENLVASVVRPITLRRNLAANLQNGLYCSTSKTSVPGSHQTVCPELTTGFILVRRPSRDRFLQAVRHSDSRTSARRAVTVAIPGLTESLPALQ
jgi:hypothetical protein